MAVGDIYLVTFVQEQHGQAILNTVHYKETVSGGAAGAATLAAKIDADAGPVWRAALSDEWEYQYTQVQKIYPGVPQFPVVVGTNAGIGSVANDPEPTSVSIVVTKRTALAGPAYRGRIYLAGIPVTYINDSALSSTGVTGLTGVAEELIEPKTSGGYTFVPVIWHKASLTSDDITGLTLRTTVRNQRRRQLRRGI